MPLRMPLVRVRSPCKGGLRPTKGQAKGIGTPRPFKGVSTVKSKGDNFHANP